jgi:solute carrier family 10 (sodium/bile acid cotransporter), member 7
MFKWLSTFDKFVPALLLVILAASFFPEPAAYEGGFTLHNLGDIGITLIFLFYGLKLNARKLRQDLGNWRLHLLVQIATFLLFPLLVLPFYYWWADSPHALLWLGGFFLATLPSTVSSSVVMVSIAKGNVPGAIFNASISSLAGILITPLWMGLVLTTAVSGSGETGDYSTILLKLLLQVLLPVMAGLLLNRFFGHWAQRNARFLKLFDQSVILLIVYLSFGESFYFNLFADTSTTDILLIMLLCTTLFFLVFGIIHLMSRRLQFNREDRITALFAGSKKSLVHGTVMAGILFKGMTGVGVILLPLMIYHALQLVFVGILAQRMGRKGDRLLG